MKKQAKKGTHQRLKKTTSWGKEACWYAEHLGGEDTYHAKVILPNLLRIIAPESGMCVLEVGCGEGFFSRALAAKGATVVASDISPELIALAKEKGGGVDYRVSKAEELAWVEPQSFDVVLAVLTLQNMERIEPVFEGIKKALRTGGRFVFVINHPAFRLPKASSWGIDPKARVQYRRVDRYLSARKERIDMHPGKHGSESFTYSFHRSLQDYAKALRTSGFQITRLEEWISHKTSESGPHAKMEDTARKEFPLFLMIECTRYA